jgi:hypothetical protein
LYGIGLLLKLWRRGETVCELGLLLLLWLLGLWGWSNNILAGKVSVWVRGRNGDGDGGSIWVMDRDRKRLISHQILWKHSLATNRNIGALTLGLACLWWDKGDLSPNRHTGGWNGHGSSAGKKRRRNTIKWWRDYREWWRHTRDKRNLTVTGHVWPLPCHRHKRLWGDHVTSTRSGSWQCGNGRGRGNEWSCRLGHSTTFLPLDAEMRY